MNGPTLTPLQARVSAQDFLANFTEPLVILDGDWRIVYANPHAARLYGKPPELLLGRPPWDQWPPPTHTEIENQHRRALQTQTSIEIPHSDSNAALELRAFSCDLGIIIYYHDLDWQRTTSELQERLAAIVESSDDAIISKDLNGIILTWNRGAERIFGYKEDEIIGKHISTLAAPEVIDEIPDILKRIARGERVDHYQTK